MKYKLINQRIRHFMLGALTVIALPTLAQQADSYDSGSGMPAPQEAPNATNRPPVTVSTGMSEQFKTDVDKSGTMSISRFQAGIAAPLRLNDDLVLNTSFRFGLDRYNFDGLSPFWFNAWHNIQTYNLGTCLQWKIDDHWSIYGGGLIRESGESAVEFEKGITGGGLAGFNYQYSDTLSFGLGLGVMSQLKEDANILPLATVNWRFADKWHLKLGLTDVATYGYGAAVSYDIAQDWEWSLGLHHEKSRFRIEGSNKVFVTPFRLVGPTKNGVGQEESSVLYTEVLWHATSRVDICGYVGLTMGGDIRLEDRSGNTIDSSNYDTAAIVGLKASLQL